ncbi:uncharacterized protein LOC119726060 [Patiria miniata]|uniref:Uncharacterized protein n=1 Tax=Patiria miniata TaxID=46514 RepID=A0A913ZR36_PATMI|nr:uncharacterized protein LOC119726060 [Patiria miniata]
MPQKTIQDLDAYIKATAVVYDHSNTKLVSRKTKVSRRRKEAFLSVLPYRKPSSHYHSHERKTSSWITRKQRSKPTTECHTKDVKQKLLVFVRTPSPHRPKTLYFELHPETSVSSLKEVIQKKIGVEARYQRLYIREIFQLCDLLTLEENGVDKNEIISLRLSIEDPKDKANIDDEYLKDLSSKIESSWKELAKHLGFEEAEIANIQTTNEGSTEESRHMLLTWWEKTTDRDEAAKKLRRALEAIRLTDLAQNVPVTNESSDEAAGPEPERRQDAGVDEENKQNGAASTDEENVKNDEVPNDKAAIDDEYLKGLSPKIESSWKELAKHLGFAEAEIADIQTTNKGSIADSCHMLLTWWEKTTDRDEAAQKLRRALEAIGLTDFAQNVLVTSESRDEAAGPEPEGRQDAGVDEESKQNGAASTEEEKLKKEPVGDQDKPGLIRYLQVFIRIHCSHRPKIMCLQVDPETSVLLLKVIISEKIGVPPQKHRLFIRRNFRNFELHNLLTLHDCGIHQDENISLRLCTDGLLGGGHKVTKGIKQNETTSLEDQRRGQQGVVHRHKSQPPVQVGGTGTESRSVTKRIKQKETTSSEDQRQGQQGATHRDNPQTVTGTESRSGTLPDDKSIWNQSKKIGTRWEELALNLDFSKEDINIIKADHPNNTVRQCFEMLSAWWRKQDNYTEARRTLEKALIDSGRQELDRGISAATGRAQSSPSDAADQCRSELKERYITTGSYVQLIPWVDDDMKHIRDIYTELQLEKGDQDDIEGDVAEYGDIFLVKTKDGNVIKRGILSGSPGMGKSTIIDKMAYDWAVGGALGQFSLLFVLKMSALKETSELVESVFSQLLADDTAVDKGGLEAFIKDNGSRVLILIDGFDEFTTTNLEPEKFGSILRMLNRKFGKECFVVVTTRPSHLNKLKSKSLIEKPFTHVNVLGFRREDIGQYVRNFFPAKLDEAEGLLDRIRSSNVMSDLARSPMILLLMCSLWREEGTLPDTLSRLFSEAIRYIFQRKMSELSEEAISEVVIAIGKVALEGLVYPEQRLSFQEREFEKSALDKAIQVGILTSQRVIKWRGTDNNVQFIHKTLQEYCAAIYCQSLLRNGDGEFQKILDKLGDPMHFEYMLRFCCGDNEKCTRHVLRMLHQKFLQELALNCYFESQSKGLFSDFIEWFFTESIEIYYNSKDSLNSFVWLLQHVAEHTGPSGVDYLAKVRQVTFKKVDLSGSIEIVPQGFGRCTAAIQ